MEKMTAKRLLALLLALVMALSMLPAIALAEGTGEQVFTADKENLRCEKGVWIAARAENNVLTFPNRNWCRWEEGKLTIPCDPIGTDTLYFAVDRNDGLTIGGKVQTPVGTLEMTMDYGPQTCKVYAFHRLHRCPHLAKWGRKRLRGVCPAVGPHPALCGKNRVLLLGHWHFHSP